MGNIGISIGTITLVCCGMYLAIRYGVKQAMVDFEAGREDLVQKKTAENLLNELAGKLSSYSMPGAMPKNMTKEERKAMRKRINKISTAWSFSTARLEDAEKFNKEAQIIIDEINEYADDLDEVERGEN